jgi:FSR family fosmidomycin resistance protein-like MFS transporter
LPRLSTVPRLASKPTFVVLTLLTIEFLDEFVFGARKAAWPWIRAELGLSYTQIGMLLSLPNVSSSVIEPVLGILGDTGRRRALVLGGGLVFALSLSLTAASQGFALLLLSFVLCILRPGARACILACEDSIR